MTAAIEEMQISRGFYYQLETKALLAMLRSVAPGSDGATTPDGATMSARVSELEARIAKLEQDKRRLERLLYLTRQILPTGPVALGPGRRKKTSNPTSTRAGSRGLPSSKRKLTIRRATSTPSTSTLTPAGGDEP